MTTSKRVLLLTTLLLSQAFFGQVHDHALFGEHNRRVSFNPAEVYHIRLDKNGDFYPNSYILDSQIVASSGASLRSWAEIHKDEFASILKTYKVKESGSFQENFNTLQDSIIATISREINNNAQGLSQTWLIHGYRKRLYHYESRNTDATSLHDNQEVEKVIKQYCTVNQIAKPYFVHVYWDGRYRFLNIYTALSLPGLFTKAIPNAQNCGYSLRKIFNRLDNSNVKIITHSTGTYVGANLLFDQDEKRVYQEPAPRQKISWALVASASPGKKLFKRYSQRGGRQLNPESIDNYTIINVYNKGDNVLIINSIWPFSPSSSLGCNRWRSSFKLNEFFSENYPSSKYLDQAVFHQDGQVPHFFNNYANSPGFQVVLDVLFKDS
jgi:hypothetical protein